ncbi:MAG: hypothetical protein Q9218_001076 [Villophora microphyllina]
MEFVFILNWLYPSAISRTIGAGLESDYLPTWAKWHNPFKLKAIIEYADVFIAFQADSIIPTVITGSTSVRGPYIVELTDRPVELTDNLTNTTTHITYNRTDHIHIQPLSTWTEGLLLCILGLTIICLYVMRQNRQLKEQTSQRKILSKLTKKLSLLSTANSPELVINLRQLRPDTEQQRSQDSALNGFGTHIDWVISMIEKANNHDQKAVESGHLIHVLTNERDGALSDKGTVKGYLNNAFTTISFLENCLGISLMEKRSLLNKMNTAYRDTDHWRQQFFESSQLWNDQEELSRTLIASLEATIERLEQEAVSTKIEHKGQCKELEAAKKALRRELNRINSTLGSSKTVNMNSDGTCFSSSTNATQETEESANSATVQKKKKKKKKRRNPNSGYTQKKM